jgi:hypothetical protein
MLVRVAVRNVAPEKVLRQSTMLSYQRFLGQLDLLDREVEEVAKRLHEARRGGTGKNPAIPRVIRQLDQGSELWCRQPQTFALHPRRGRTSPSEITLCSHPRRVQNWRRFETRVLHLLNELAC